MPLPRRSGGAGTRELRAAPVLLLALALALASCSDTQGAPAGGGGPRAAVVEIGVVHPEMLRDLIRFPGQLAAEATVELRTETEGILESVEFEEGAAVEEGQVLFRLRDAEERARLQEARAELSLAEARWERTKKLVEREVASTADLDRTAAERDVAAARVARARVELERRTIRAPFDGLIGALEVAPGDSLREQTTLTRIDAVDRLQLRFSLPELALGRVAIGAPVSITVAPYGDEKFAGEVYFVSPSVDPQSRRGLVKAWIPNPKHRLRPGMFAEVEAEIARRDGAILVPEAALVHGLEGTTIWRVGPDERASGVPVEVGLRQDGRVEVSGLAPGDRVVVAGVHKVSEGGLVRDARATPPPALGQREDGAGGDAS
jgi:membrane fusion protein (multidrug efflux system)